jgi:hypothetical protein
MLQQTESKPSRLVMIVVAAVTFIVTLAVFWTDAPG